MQTLIKCILVDNVNIYPCTPPISQYCPIVQTKVKLDTHKHTHISHLLDFRSCFPGCQDDVSTMCCCDWQCRDAFCSHIQQHLTWSFWCCWSVLSSVRETPISLKALSLSHCSRPLLLSALRLLGVQPRLLSVISTTSGSLWPSPAPSSSLSLSLCNQRSINNSAYGSRVGRQAAHWRQAKEHCWPKTCRGRPGGCGLPLRAFEALSCCLYFELYDVWELLL